MKALINCVVTVEVQYDHPNITDAELIEQAKRYIKGTNATFTGCDKPHRIDEQ